MTVLPEALKSHAENERLRHIEYEQLRAIAKSAARMVAGNYYDLAYEDIVNPKPEDTRDVHEVIDDIVSRAGLEVIK